MIVVVVEVCRWRHCAILSTAAAQYHTHHGGRSSRPCPPGAAAAVAVAVTLSFGARVRASVYGVYVCMYCACATEYFFECACLCVCVCMHVCMYVCAHTARVPCVCVCASLSFGVVNKKLSVFLFFRHRSYFGEVRIGTDETDDTVYVRRSPAVRRSVALIQSDRLTAVTRCRPAVSQTAADLF